MAVRFVMGDEHVDAAAIRLVPLQKKFHWAAFGLADKLGLTRPRATALRQHLGIDDDADCCYVFTFGSQQHLRFSDNAYTRMRDAIDGSVDMAEIWASHGTGKHQGPRPACRQAGCSSAKVAS